jgi:hypothetical protein
LAASTGKAKIIALLLARHVTVPDKLIGSFRSSIAAIYTVYLFFTQHQPDVLLGDLLPLITAYLTVDNTNPLDDQRTKFMINEDTADFSSMQHIIQSVIHSRYY